MTTQNTKASTLLVIIAFALVYVVWGSTYFFIQIAVKGIPPFMMGAMRFLASGLLLFTWCLFTGKKLWIAKNNIHSAISGALMLFGGTGCLIWAERTVPSAVTAILVSAAPIWFILMDVSHWKVNFKNTYTIVGLIIGFAGIMLLFGEQLSKSFGVNSTTHISDMIILVIGSISWSAGSLYSKYKASDGEASVNTTWQMIAAGVAFVPFSLLHGEFTGIDFAAIPASAWWAVAYLVIFGSIVAFSAYVWLLSVRSATQVSTYAYVNPVIAVILGVAFAHENISLLQILGLVVILGSVLLINFTKYFKTKTEQVSQAEIAEA
ncbi:EamA family transporter [Mucilaginibacter gynuensis]|uniref:EamA family transporter n=1 Tax=Mucilaginibacter gynuensis TaxID=1302236 RepID=A0ABP8G2D3_9SPHI